MGEGERKAYGLGLRCKQKSLTRFKVRHPFLVPCASAKSNLYFKELNWYYMLKFFVSVAYHVFKPERANPKSRMILYE
jgi:hypothetical protein